MPVREHNTLDLAEIGPEPGAVALEGKILRTAVENGTGLAGWQLRVLLMRGPGAPSPRVEGVGAVVSRLPDVSGVASRWK